MKSKGIYFGIFSNVFGNLLMLGATLWLTHILSPEQFGQFRVGSNFAILLVPFLALGGERLISRLIQNHKDDPAPVSTAITSILLIVSIGFFLLAISYPILSTKIFDNNLPIGVYYISICIIPLTIAYNLGNTIWRHFGDAAFAQVDLNFTQRLLRAPLLISFSFLWPSALAPALAMTIAQAISLFRIRRYLLKFPPQGIRKMTHAIRATLPEMVLIGIPVAIMAAVDRLDVLLINALMGVEQAGSYDLIYMLSLTALFPTMALSKTTEPFLHGIAKDRANQKRLKLLQTKAFFLSCAAVAGIAMLAPIMKNYLGNAGPEFSLATLAISSGLAFSSTYGPVIEYLQINGKARITLLAVILLLLIFFALKFISASLGSLTGIAMLAGLFYFSLRLVLAIYIRITDGIFMSPTPILATSLLLYLATNVYIFISIN